MKGHPYIQIRNASLGYTTGQEARVLSGLNLDFTGGDFVGVVGLNGSGKSTLLKSISGLLPVLDGHIVIDGTDQRQLELAQMATRVAVVLTGKVGGFNLTAYDVVAAGRIPYTNAFNRLTHGHREIITAAIASCGIGHHAHKPVAELSDGLFQKTIIARALAQQTPVMLLDEPSAFLDYASKHNLFKQLAALATDDHKCILISSHDLDLVLRYCNRLCIVANGGAQTVNVADARSNAAFMEMAGGFL